MHMCIYVDIPVYIIEDGLWLATCVLSTPRVTNHTQCLTGGNILRAAQCHVAHGNM
jgi:hypothetical protein